MIADSAVTTAKINDAAVTNAKLGADSVNGSKIADNSINSEHYVDGSIDTAHIADSQITTAKIADTAVTTAKITDSNITTAKLASNSVTTVKITDSNVTTAKIAADAIDGTKIADDSINSEHYVDGSIDTAHIANSQITTAKIADSNVTTAKIADSNVTTAKINNDAVTINKIADAVIITNAEASGHTPDDVTFLTTSASDSLYFRQDSSETINSGQSWSSSDAFIATTAAIDARVTDLVDDVGGFVPIANETSFPNANPDVNNGAGTIVSISSIGSTRTPSGGTVSISGGTVGGSTVTITGCGSTVLTAGFGVLVETSTTLNTYTFHRLVPKATEVTTVAAISSDITTVAGDTTDIGVVSGLSSDIQSLANIEDGTTATNAISNVGNNISSVVTTASNISGVNSFADRYRISSSAPTTSLDSGDLYFNTSTNVLNVYGASGWQNAGSSVNGTSQRYNYTATNAQTTFTGSDNNSNTLAYDAGFIDVYLNGVKLLNGTDVTVTSGSSVVLASGATTGDVVDIVAYGTFSVASLNADNLDSGTVPDARISGTYTGITGLTVDGDVTFTGDSYNAFWDKSDNRLEFFDNTKIVFGNSADLQIYHNGSASFIEDTGTGDLIIRSGDDLRLEDTNGDKYINCNENTGVEIYYNGSKKFETTSNGVAVTGGQIRTNSSTSTLSIQGGSTYPGAKIQMAGGQASSNPGTMIFLTDDGNVANPSERARIDANGNLLVGKTSSSTSTAGIELLNTGTVNITRSGGNAVVINRLGSNGGVVNFKKDGTEFGRISVRSNTDMAIGSSDTAITFKNSTETIYPSNMAGEGRDNAIDLGDTSTRFQDLYLGGGLYVGGTGTANKLDDYEEGTFTPSDQSGAGLNLNPKGQYTKIGSIVHFSVNCNFPSNSSSAGVLIGGLPFTVGDAQTTDYYGGYITATNTNTTATLLCSRNTTEIAPRTLTNGDIANSTYSSKFINFSGYYSIL